MSSNIGGYLPNPLHQTQLRVKELEKQLKEAHDIILLCAKGIKVCKDRAKFYSEKYELEKDPTCLNYKSKEKRVETPEQ